MKNLYLLLVILILKFSLLTGQKAPIKFGDVSIEELHMQSYPLDTSAIAIVLCDYGHLNPSTAQFIRIRRIKILKKEGLTWANSSYPYNLNSHVKGLTTNLVDGKIISEKLKSESIFRDKITENTYITRVAMPNVKVGSVIDLEFTFSGIMQEWKFQDEIPVKYSELLLPYVNNVGFSYNYFGYEPLYFSSSTRWIAKDMPSFKVEPYISSKENFLTKLEFDLSYVGYISLTESWEIVSQILLKESNFGLAISSSRYLNSLAESIADSGSDSEGMLKRAYDSVKSTVKWDENESLMASSPNLNFPYKMKIGNSADINLILLQLLKKLNIEVIPVAISTRENGFISKLAPSLQKLNYVILLARIGNKSFLLDATEKNMPYYLIPFRCLNGAGRTINTEKSEEVILNTIYKDKDYTTYQVKLNNDLRFVGNLIIRRLEYSAFDFRKKYSSFNSSSEFLEDFKKNKIGLTINEYRINNIDSIYLPIIENYDVTLQDQLNVIANEVYITPTFYNQFKENPFKMNIRNYPIDYGYNIEKTITSIIEIPENCEVSELPASVNIKLPDNSASLTYMVVKSGNTINIKSIFSINKSLFLPSEYKVLKEFYDQVIKKHSEPIILKKI